MQYRRFAAEARLITGEETQAPAEDEAPPEQAPEPWLELGRTEQPTPIRAPPASPSGVATIRASVELVEVPVIVKDRRGEPVNVLEERGLRSLRQWRAAGRARFSGREPGTEGG